jgi:hypothetical protein
MNPVPLHVVEGVLLCAVCLFDESINLVIQLEQRKFVHFTRFGQLRGLFCCLNFLHSASDADVIYSHLVFARNGKRMISVTRSPHAQLGFWEIHIRAPDDVASSSSSSSSSSSAGVAVSNSGLQITLARLVDASLAELMGASGSGGSYADEVSYASFNPRSKRQFLLGGPRALSLWQVDVKFEQYSLTKVYADHPRPPCTHHHTPPHPTTSHHIPPHVTTSQHILIGFESP